MERRANIAKWLLALYFIVFLLFLYLPLILMAVLSFQGRNGQITWPFRGPLSGRWWEMLWRNPSIFEGHAPDIHAAALNSLWLSLAAGAIVALIAFSLSMAFRRRFWGDGIAFYFVMLALMTPGFLLSVGTQFFWKLMHDNVWSWMSTGLWKTALGANTVWGIPFGFLVMLAVWNRYDRRVEEAARDLGADQKTTFREVTLPLVWTGVFGAFLFGFTLAWNDYDHTVLLLGNAQNTLPVQIFALTFGSNFRPDTYALGTATTLLTLLLIGIVLTIITIRGRLRGPSAPPEETEIQSFDIEAGHLEDGQPGGPAGAPARAK